MCRDFVQAHHGQHSEDQKRGGLMAIHVVGVPALRHHVEAAVLDVTAGMPELHNGASGDPRRCQSRRPESFGALWFELSVALPRPGGEADQILEVASPQAMPPGDQRRGLKRVGLAVHASCLRESGHAGRNRFRPRARSTPINAEGCRDNQTGLLVRSPAPSSGRSCRETSFL